MVLRRNVGANLKIICVREQQQQHVDVWFVRTALRDPSTNQTGPQWTNSSKNGIKPNLTWFQFKGWNQLVFFINFMLQDYFHRRSLQGSYFRLWWIILMRNVKLCDMHFFFFFLESFCEFFQLKMLKCLLDGDL